MFQIRSVLAATDFGTAEEVVLQQADRWARAWGAALHVCHVVPLVGRSYVPFSATNKDTPGSLFELRDRIGEMLVSRATRATGRRKGEFTAHVDQGTPYAGIVRIAETVEADLVVVAASSSLQSITSAFGTTALSVVRHAPCAVLVARPSRDGSPVFAATDLSDPAVPALDAAAEAARRFSLPLRFFHGLEPLQMIAPPPEPGLATLPGLLPAGSIEQARKDVEAELRATLVKLGAEGEVEVATGMARSEILAAARAAGAGLIVVGTRGRTGLSRVILGSVAEDVIRGATCPVLAVRLRTEGLLGG
ncbi:MAG: universal stress protein [Candidatus Brocadiae bacterium]|nr:universal stress protein [Candidatus Brocadiia bacterium]